MPSSDMPAAVMPGSARRGRGLRILGVGFLVSLTLVELAAARLVRPEALGPEQHHRDQDRAIDQELELGELAEQLRQADEGQRTRRSTPGMLPMPPTITTARR